MKSQKSNRFLFWLLLLPLAASGYVFLYILFMDKNASLNLLSSVLFFAFAITSLLLILYLYEAKRFKFVLRITSFICLIVLCTIAIVTNQKNGINVFVILSTLPITSYTLFGNFTYNQKQKLESLLFFLFKPFGKNYRSHSQIITFITNKFDVSKEDKNPYNPIYGQSLLLWLKEIVSDEYKIDVPFAEDWGWYSEINWKGEKYSLSAVANDIDNKFYEWKLMIDKKNITPEDDCFLYFKRILETESDFKDFKIE